MERLTHLDSGAWGPFSQPRAGIKKTRLFSKGSFGNPEATTVPEALRGQYPVKKKKDRLKKEPHPLHLHQ